MALSRKSLKAMGLTDEQIETVIDMHSETVNDLKDKIADAEAEKANTAKYKTEAEKYKAELEAANKTIAENATYKEQYETTKAEYDRFKTDTETKAAKAAVDGTFAKWLKDNGYTDKGAAKIVKYGGFEVELNKDGTIKNADKLAESVNAEWAEYKTSERVEGAKTETPPTTTGGKTKMTKEDILNIKNTADRQKAIAENPEYFPQLAKGAN